MLMETNDSLFGESSTRYVETSSGRIFCRIVGTGPPLLLLHGYPQTHTMWHQVAPYLQDRFTLILPDLPGYGSSALSGMKDTQVEMFSKRQMALTFVELMRELGYERFSAAGHDRGGRVCYRMAFDHPDVLNRVAILDILPTYEYWNRLDHKTSVMLYHWMFLAQPEPLPETLIGADPALYFSGFFDGIAVDAHGTKGFHPEALREYIDVFSDPTCIHAACQDYRAGATFDYMDDAKDRDSEALIEIPLLALWGTRGAPPRIAKDPERVWKTWARQLETKEIEGGHFFSEESPQETGTALREFFQRNIDEH